jgi:hypothetical protein
MQLKFQISLASHFAHGFTDSVRARKNREDGKESWKAARMAAFPGTEGIIQIQADTQTNVERPVNEQYWLSAGFSLEGLIQRAAAESSGQNPREKPAEAGWDG